MKTKLIAVLSAIVLFLSGYLLYNSLNNDMSEAEIQSQFVDLKSDYEFIQKDLEAAVQNINFGNKEILSQKKRIDMLMKKDQLSQEELSEAKEIMRNISKTFLKKYKDKITSLEADQLKLLQEKLKIVSEKDKLTTQVTQLSKEIDELDRTVTKEKIVSKKKDQLITYASKLSLSNFSLRSFKVRSNGKEIETDRASRIDRIKFSFDVNDNVLAESGEKLLYMVIKKPSGETVTFSNKPSGIFLYNNKKLLYSDKYVFNYTKGKEEKLEFVWDSEEFGRGDYVMEVYEQTKQMVLPIGKVTKKLD